MFTNRRPRWTLFPRAGIMPRGPGATHENNGALLRLAGSTLGALPYLDSKLQKIVLGRNSAVSIKTMASRRPLNEDKLLIFPMF